MSPRIGRPPTGRTPNISIRLKRDAYDQARAAAKHSHKSVGAWLEEAIRDKLQRKEGTK